MSVLFPQLEKTKSGLCYSFFFLIFFCSIYGNEENFIEENFKDSALIKAEKISDNVDISLLDISLSAECEPTVIVAGCVNAASGHFLQMEQDLLDNTIDPITLTRYYDSGSSMESFLGMGFGSQFPLLATDVQESAKHSYGMISERDGFLIPYKGKCHHSKHHCTIDPRILEKGYTNLNRVGISGHANFVNWEAIHRETNQGKKWEVKLGDGSKRTYKNPIKLTHKSRHQIGFPSPKNRHPVAFPSKKAYLLTEETKANGNKLQFNYKIIADKPHLIRVRTLNRTGSTILNELNLEHFAEDCRVSSSCKNKIHYHLYTKKILDGAIEKRLLGKVTSSQYANIHYRLKENRRGFPILVQVDKPEGRYVKIDYNESNKVEKLSEPLGPNGEEVKSYQFAYEEKRTKVWDALSQLTCYTFDTHQRLSTIDTLDHDRVIRQKVFRWSQQPNQEGWLKTKSIRIGEKIFCLMHYEYDQKGNIIQESLFGNLTGEKAKTYSSQQLSEMDQYAIQYEYTQDDRNLLVSKATPQNLKIFYDYLSGTNLCTHEFHLYNGKIQERTFYHYDENGQLTQTIEDDGSGQLESDFTDMTFRKIKTITAETRIERCSFGKPKIITESYYQNGTLIPLNTTEITYDSKGNESRRKVTNSSNTVGYVTTKFYDERQRIIQEIDALGLTNRYAYDENNNKTEEELVGSGKCFYFTYDSANRLIQKREQHSNGHVFITRYSYNLLNQLISEIDPYDQETTYTYDRLGRQTSCAKPIIQDSQGGLIRPTITKVYNTLGHVKSETNENGYTTRYQRNIRGQPTLITYPDQSIERYAYYPCGWLRQKWHTDGTSITYHYDGNGHVIQENTHDSMGTVIKQEFYGYKGTLLIYKIDAMGLMTTYAYDGAGRKIAEQTGDRLIEYQWDDFNRLILKKQDSQCEITQYDARNRIISKVLQSIDGTIFAKETYEFDIYGNQTKKSVWHSQNEVAVSTSRYESDGGLQWSSDPLGNRTHWNYNHHHHNGIQQRIQARSIIDPLGRVTLECDDTHHRVIRRDQYENGMQVSCHHIHYDGVGHPISERSQVMKDGQILREYGFSSTYNNRGWLASETEFPQGATYYFDYDSRGNLIKKTKPDGNILRYSYDALGRMSSQTSSEGSIHYRYTYDLHDNLIEIQDVVRHTVQKREYDAMNRLIKEELSHGTILQYNYDSFGRPTQMILPDSSKVRYHYDPFHLKKIERFLANGLNYEIECPVYDLKGNLLQIFSPAGSTQNTYDLLGRCVKIQNSSWETSLDQLDQVGNLLSMKQSTPRGVIQECFSYNRFDHLTSESLHNNQYEYDSVGNCLKKNQSMHEVNALNQTINDGNSQYSYDANGNLLSQSHPSADYRYDALDRLTFCEKDGVQTVLQYDSSGRCLQINDHQLVYQQDHEIGSLLHGQLYEFKLVHPQNPEITLALELNGETYFPIQDHRHHISALKTSSGFLAQWYRYSAFGLEEVIDETASPPYNPWRFANRRDVAGLSLFKHRFYNPTLMRWQTADPLRFADGLNKYTYTRNNPFVYYDPDGRFVFVIPLITIAIGAECAIGFTTMTAIGGAILGAAVGWGCSELYDAYYKHDKDACDEEEKRNERKPPFNGQELGEDPARCPGEGFEWRGRDAPGGRRGNWYNETTEETLHPDLNHEPPINPHWDYTGPGYQGARLYTDGTWENK